MLQINAANTGNELHCALLNMNAILILFKYGCMHACHTHTIQVRQYATRKV